MKKVLLLVLLFTASSFSFAVSVDQNLLNKAKSGDRASQEEIAKFYRFSGEEGESLSWLYKAYENGSGYAAGKIAKAYYDGKMGLQRDRSEARSWYRKGAELNDKTSLIFIVDHYAKETVKQYRESSGYNNPKYSDSYTLELQRKEERQARAGKEQALKYLIQCINELKDAECNVRYAKLKRSLSGNLDNSAFEALKRAGNAGNYEAYTELALYFENGYIVEKDTNMAYKYLKTAAAKNEKNALGKLGEAYLQAHKYNLAKDEEKGINYLEKAGALGNGDAYRTLGDYYFTDKNNAVDLNRAIGYYEKGVALGNPYAAWNLAALYSAHDEKLEKSRSYYTKEMAKLMALAADGGLLEAQLALASAHEKGQFGLHSRSKAKYYYELAAKQGSGEAKLKLKGFN